MIIVLLGTSSDGQWRVGWLECSVEQSFDRFCMRIGLLGDSLRGYRTSSVTISITMNEACPQSSIQNELLIFIKHFPFSFADTSDKSDQSTAASWWRSHLTTPGSGGGGEPPLDNNFFSATHGLVQTHPSLSGGIPRPAAPNTGSRASPSSSGSLIGSLGTVVNPNPKSPFRHLDFATSATAELRRNPSLSAPDECARACREGEPPRICYYHFTLEYYTVLGA